MEVSYNEPRFSGVYPRNNLTQKIKDRTYVINLDEYADIETHQIALYVLNIGTIYFDSFGVEHVPKEIIKIIRNKNIKPNIFGIQSNKFTIYGYFCIGFIDFMLADKTLIDDTSLFSIYNNIFLRYFENE